MPRRAAARPGRGSTISTRPSSCWSTPPWRRSTRRPATGPESSAVLASTSASSALGAAAVAATRPVQAGSPVEGSSTWWAKAPSSRRHSRSWIPEVATPPLRTRSRWTSAPVAAPVTATSHSPPPSGEVAADRDRVAHARAGPAPRRRRRRGPCRARPSPAARPAAAPRARRRAPRSARSRAPAAAARDARRGGGQRVGQRRGRQPGARGRVAGGLDLAGQRRVDQPAARLARPQRRAREPRHAAASAGTAARGSALRRLSSEPGSKRVSRRSASASAARTAAAVRRSSGSGTSADSSRTRASQPMQRKRSSTRFTTRRWPAGRRPGRRPAALLRHRAALVGGEARRRTARPVAVGVGAVGLGLRGGGAARRRRRDLRRIGARAHAPGEEGQDDQEQRHAHEHETACREGGRHPPSVGRGACEPPKEAPRLLECSQKPRRSLLS